MNTARRKRRIAADEAHAWARNLRLHNPIAKLVLSMLTLYVDGDGSCFVGAAALAEDCELAIETVRRRLSWLEGIGALVRIPQWLDEKGHRTSSGTGRRTSDEIRLLMGADAEEIEEKAKNSASDSDKVNTPSGRGLNEEPKSDQESVSSPLGVGLPTNSGVGLISEPEPEPEAYPTLPQAGGDENEFEQRQKGGERLRLIEPIWPDPITDAHRAINVLQALTDAEWNDCLTGAKGYAKFIRERRADGQKRIAKDFHNWARNQQWVGYLTSGKKVEAVAALVRVEADSEAGKAWAVLHKIAHIKPLDFNGIYVLPGPLSAQVLALAQAPREIEWTFIAGDQVHQCAAWSDLIVAELKDKARPRLVAAHGQNPGSAVGFMAPWPWPPRKDGTFSTTGPPETLMTEQDLRDFA